MSKQLGFFIDVSRCTGCRTCQVACKDKNNLEVGRNFRHVLAYEGGSWRQDRLTGAWHTDAFAYYVSISCNECTEAPCTKVCPTKAHYKRASDGLVLIDSQKCIGCGACAATCKNGSAMLFVAARVSSLAKLPQGRVEGARRAKAMVAKMDELGFGNCTNTGACQAECPKQISIAHIARLNREFLSAKFED